jgi:hypothetical protein
VTTPSALAHRDDGDRRLVNVNHAASEVFGCLRRLRLL